MFGIGFSELLLIAVVALVVVGPKDLPVVIKHIARFIHDLRGVYLGVKRQMDQVMDEAGFNDIHQHMATIIDLDGTPQKAYDVSTLHELAAPVDKEIKP